MIRELFVELEKAVFDELKAVGLAFEAAIAEAARQRVVREDALNERHRRPPEAFLKLLLEHFRPEWRLRDVIRDAFDRQTIIRVRLPCRHTAEIPLDEMMFVRARDAREIGDYIVRELQRDPQRRCFCVQRQPQPNCTAGACS